MAFTSSAERIMKIDYKNGKMIVKHPSGHVDEYTKEQLESEKKNREAGIVSENNELLIVKMQIAETENSMGT